MSSIHPLDTYLSPAVHRPPPFIYLHHPFHSSTQALPASLHNPDGSTVSIPTSPDSSARILHGKIVLTIPASSLSSPKALYTLVLHLVRLCLFPESVQKEVEDKGKVKEVHQWDTFVRGLGRVLEADVSSHSRRVDEVEGAQARIGEKRKRREDDDETVRSRKITGRPLVLILQDAHLLGKNLGTAFESLLRLSKMMEHPTCLILLSSKTWDDARPISGSSVEPLGLFLRRETKEEVISALLALEKEGPIEIEPVYPYFLSLLYATSAHLIPQDAIATLARLTKALWPIYTAGLDERVAIALPTNGGENGDDTRITMQMEGPPKTALKVTTSLLIDLKNRSTYAFALANEHLIPDKISVETFVQAFRREERSPVDGPKTDAEKAFFALMPSARGTGEDQSAGPSTSTSTPMVTSRLSANPIILKPAVPPLPLYAKYLVLAAYCASYNSVKSDMRMFGRGPLTSASGLKGRTGLGLERNSAGYAGGGKVGGKTGQGLKKVKLGKVGKIPQYLLGPRSFPLERLLAIFQALLFEHGFDPSQYESDSEDDLELENGRDDEEDDAFSDVNRPAGKLDFRIEEDAGKAERKRRERERQRDKERLRDWEEEVEEISRSVGLFGLIPELESMRLLQRTTPKDRLDQILIRCEAQKDMVMTFARSLKIDLKGYLVESE